MKKLITSGSFSFGGWVFDTDFIPTMGLPYLMAHGMGEPVADAEAGFSLPEGKYHTWLYTFNWVAPWHEDAAPGKYELLVDGVSCGIFGDAPSTWGWVRGQDISVLGEKHKAVLHDLTGFDGRVAAILLTDEEEPALPGVDGIFDFYMELTGNPGGKEITADFAVVGGGLAGMCAAVMASRRGLKTVLIQDRPVVGGNNSSEARVWLGGGTNADPLPGVGNIVNEFEQDKARHYGPENKAELYEDERKEKIVREAGVELYLNCTMKNVSVKDGKIDTITVWDTHKDEVFTVKAPLYADCTGDGTLGTLAGAHFEVTTNGHMGRTNFWCVEDTGEKQIFPPCPWAVQLYGIDIPGRVKGGAPEIKKLGCWYWETGMERDPIVYGEYARDLNLRAMYGAWDALKNYDHDYETYKITESTVIGGMRESRRLLGDVILTKADVYSDTVFPDACVPSFWNFDVHYPHPKYYSAFHEGDGFLTLDYHEGFRKPYWVPYRCFYSRNIPNLFMAGRDVSVSHEALGTVRVMRTCGMMGEIVGLAAYLCREHNVLPRNIYTDYLEELMGILRSLPKRELRPQTKAV